MHNFQCLSCSVGFPFFEILLVSSRRICDMGQTQHRRLPRLSECVESRRFHFDSEHAYLSGVLNGPGCFPKRRIGCPTRPGEDAQSLALERTHGDCDELWVRLGELRWGGIMVAGPLVSQRALRDNEVRRRCYRINLTGRGEAEKKV